MIDHYKVLHVAPNATHKEIKRAFRKRSLQTHPDKEGGSNAAFRAVKEAYDVLGDPQQREIYDINYARRFGGAAASSSSSSSTFQQGPGGQHSSRGGATSSRAQPEPSRNNPYGAYYNAGPQSDTNYTGNERRSRRRSRERSQRRRAWSAHRNASWRDYEQEEEERERRRRREQEQEEDADDDVDDQAPNYRAYAERCRRERAQGRERFGRRQGPAAASSSSDFRDARRGASRRNFYERQNDDDFSGPGVFTNSGDEFQAYYDDVDDSSSSEMFNDFDDDRDNHEYSASWYLRENMRQRNDAAEPGRHFTGYGASYGGR